MASNEYDKRSTGFINFYWNEQDKIWSIGGNYTDEKGGEFDLGYAKTGPQGLQDAISLIAKQIGPTLSGKGIHRQDRKGNNNDNKGGGRGGR